MKLPELVARVRSEVQDTGIYLTDFGNATAAAGQNVIPVRELSYVKAGMVLAVGTGSASECKRVVNTSASSGSGTATLSSNMVGTFAANTPLFIVEAADEDYERSILEAVDRYSWFRPVLRLHTLAIVKDTQEYTLPTDWLGPDQASFDAALGKYSPKSWKGNYYADMYLNAIRSSILGGGVMLGFSGGTVSADPNDNPNGLGISLTVQVASEVTYTFVRTAPPKVIVRPKPTAAVSLDFLYRARHTAPASATDTSVPPEDLFLLEAYARAKLLGAMATSVAKLAGFKIGNEKQVFKKPDELRALAEAALKVFEDELVYTPSGMLG